MCASSHGTAPRLGQTLRYAIRIDGHAEHRGTRLFFFHSDCYAGDALVATIRNGQAGFFTAAERAAAEVTAFDPAGGARGRGYLRAEARIHPGAWYFEGHFKNDPVLPGTLMIHGAQQAMAFHLSALGLTIDQDGAAFEAVPGVTATARCRPQATPESRHVVYESTSGACASARGPRSTRRSW